MEAGDIISLPDSRNSGGGSEDGELCKSVSGLSEGDSQPSNSDAKDGTIDGENLEIGKFDIGTEKCTRGPENFGFHEVDVGNEEGTTGLENVGVNIGDTVAEDGARDGENLVLNEGDIGIADGQMEVDMDLVDSPVRQSNNEVVDTVTVEENLKSFSFSVNAENGCFDAQNDSLANSQMKASNSVSGVKRARMTFDEQQSSVHVTYNSLTRASKKKLEELLQQWSEWHVQQGSSTQNLNEMLESGEETYFPALCVGMQNSSAVSFWIENQTWKQQNDGFIPLEADSVPLYDRGYALGLTSADGPSNIEGRLEIVDEASRCFNCGSYNHSLKECPRPRDNVAVNNARKQHKSKRNQNAGSRNPIRYYQNSSGGKYDGLKPGALDAETQQLLGLGERDPPPWLNRMRELGYPPGYLDPDDEDQPSGITIFGNEEVKEEEEDGEIIERDPPEPQWKMTVKFPGINAPIPENADKKLWVAGPSSVDPHRSQSNHRLNPSSEPISRWHHNEQRWSRDFLDDRPPGVDSVFSPPASSYPPRSGYYDSSYSSDSSRDWTPSLARSHSDRGGRSMLVYEDFVSHSSSRYSSNKHSSPWDNGPARFEINADRSRDDYRHDHSFRSSNDYDRYHHRSRR